MELKHINTLEKWALVVIGIHLVAVIFHGAAHEILPVELSTGQLVFVTVVVILGPLASAFLIRKSARAGALLLAMTMTASLMFGLYFHFVGESADNVSHAAEMPSTAWSGVFTITAYLLAGLEALGALIAWLLYFKRRPASKPTTA